MASAWKTFRYETKEWAPEPSPGCYVFFIDGQLKYIGQSSNVRARLNFYGIRRGYQKENIKTPWGDGKSVVLKVRNCRKYGDWAMIELRLLRRLQPPENCAFSKKGRICG